MENEIALQSFRTGLLQEVIERIEEAETGGIKEEKFTELVIDILTEAQETENARECREIREDSIGRRLHKINGYALSENYETLDLFITIFKGNSDIQKILSDELKAAVNQSTRFLKNALNKYLEEIEETAPIFDFAKTIGTIEKELVRVNIYIVTDGLISADPPGDSSIRDILVKYHIRDIQYFFRLAGSKNKRIPIEIDFVTNYGGGVACLSNASRNNDYETFLAILPGRVLASIYKEFGSRVLEQNVRSFLQFRGKINKGIRDTLVGEPHMFLAFNNGLTATAETVQRSLDGNQIERITDFQIVNGGQTTASILQTSLKSKATDIDEVFVQLKLTVIRDSLKRAEIVSRISRYANTQNKVSEADLTSNSPFHIELEKVSRAIWAPAGGKRILTQWFYERARGQYNDELSKQTTPARKKAWANRCPKNQMFDKEDMARYWVSWNKTPWWVVRGRQRNFIEFMRHVDDMKVDNIFYEDLIAKAIIFKTAENLYGVGDKAIGDLRYIAVPYTVSWLSYKTNVNLDLHKIWRTQSVSEPMKQIIKTTLKEVDTFLRKTAPGGLIGEWGKKEECWKKLVEQELFFDTESVLEDLATEDTNRRRFAWSKEERDKHVRDSHQNEIFEITQGTWRRIHEWGRVTGNLTHHQQNIAWNIEKKSATKRDLSDIELRNGHEIIELVLKQAPETFITEEIKIDKEITEESIEFDFKSIKSMFEWERKHKRLFDKEVHFLKKLLESQKEPTPFQIQYLTKIHSKLKKQGFKS